MKEYERHYEGSTRIGASVGDLYEYVDDHRNLSAHMNESSGMMAGAKMETKIDEGEGKKVGSHITMNGKVLGVDLYLDEVVTIHEPPRNKEWETVGRVNLVVIDQYRLGFEITPEENYSKFRVYIDYNLPQSARTHWLGLLFGQIYAKWCVEQMINSAKGHFPDK